MSNNQQDVDQKTANAINNLINKTSYRFEIIRRAMDSLPADKKYDVDALLEKTRSVIKENAKDRVGKSAAKTIASKVTVSHIVEYIVHIKQQEEYNEQQQQAPQEE